MSVHLVWCLCLLIPTRRASSWHAGLSLENCTASDWCVWACIDVEAHIAPLKRHMLPSRQRLIRGAFTEAGQWRASSSMTAALSQSERARLKGWPAVRPVLRWKYVVAMKRRIRQQRSETPELQNIHQKWTQIPLETFNKSSFGDGGGKRLKRGADGVSSVLPSVY